MSDVLVPQIVLQLSSVVALIGKLTAARVPEHVRVDRKGDLRGKTATRRELAYVTAGHRAPRSETKRYGNGPVPPQLPERTQFGAAQGVGGWDAGLDALHREVPGLQVDLVPAQGDGLPDAKSMTIHQEKLGSIAGAVSAGSSGGFEEHLHLGRGQLLPCAGISVRSTSRRRDFPIYGDWAAPAGFRQFNDLAHDVRS